MFTITRNIARLSLPTAGEENGEENKCTVNFERFMMYSSIIYKAITNPYFRIVRVADGGVMVAATGAVSTTTSWDTSYTTLVRDDIRGGLMLTIPEDLPAGEYDLLIYDNASPSDSDAPSWGKRIVWSGKQILGVPLDLLNVYV